MKKKGFTLIELLAVIVILGVIMIIAIPSVTSYITNARKDSYISDATMFVNAAKTKLTADAILPQGNGEQYIVSIKDIDLDKGGEKSPYGNDWDYDRSYILVENIGTSSDPEYVWKVALNDSKGNCIPLTGINELKRGVVGTNCSILASSTGLFSPALNPSGVIPAGATYYSGVTAVDTTTFTVTAANVYSEGESFPDIQNKDIYVYGDYIYGYNWSSDFSSYNCVGCTEWVVVAMDKTKTAYGNVLVSINNEAITRLNSTFENCTNLRIAPEIPSGIIDMDYAFSGCASLTIAPKIPEGVVNMSGTFAKTAIVTAPEIPSSVKKMIGTFQLCRSLVNPPKLKEGVEYMNYTFNNCTSLKSAPTIPSTVTAFNNAFSSCPNLTGEIEINANPSNVNGAFEYTKLPIIITGSASDETKAALAATSADNNVTY